MLSRTDMRTINNWMINRGAPVKSDQQGYSKVDYSRMMEYSLKDWDKLTPKQLYYVAKVLNKYKNTQLVHYKKDIKETVEYYQPKYKLSVVGTTENSLLIKWDIGKFISDKLKGKLDKQQYAWTKQGTDWVLMLKWEYVDKFIKLLESMKVDCKQIHQAVQPTLF